MEIIHCDTSVSASSLHITGSSHMHKGIRMKDKGTTRSASDPVDQAKRETHYMPENLLEEIFLRLPIKSIFRFKCVSKRWFITLSNPSFVHRYCILKRSTAASWTFLHPFTIKENNSHGYMKFQSFYSKDFVSPSFSVLYLPSTRRILNVLDTNQGWPLGRDLEKGLYHIFNPLTQQWFTLPQPVISVPVNIFYGLIMEINGHAINSYKVIRVFHNSGHPMELIMDAFCSESGSWNACKTKKYWGSIRKFNFSRPITLNQTLYLPDYERGIVIAYDPYAEPSKPQLIRFPDKPSLGCRILGGISQGQLRLRYFVASSVTRTFDIWELIRKDEEEWCLVHTGKWIDDFLDEDGSIVSCWDTNTVYNKRWSVVCFDPFDGNAIYLEYGNHILCYHMKTRRWEILQQPERETSGYYWINSTKMPFELSVWPMPLPPPTWEADSSGHAKRKKRDNNEDSTLQAQAKGGVITRSRARKLREEFNGYCKDLFEDQAKHTKSTSKGDLKLFNIVGRNSEDLGNFTVSTGSSTAIQHLRRLKAADVRPAQDQNVIEEQTPTRSR